MNLSEQSPHLVVAGEVRAEIARQRQSGRRIALQLGWTENYMSRRLTGKAPFDVNDLAAIAGVLEVPMVSFVPADLGIIKRKRSRPRAGLLVSDRSRLGLAS